MKCCTNNHGILLYKSKFDKHFRNFSKHILVAIPPAANSFNKNFGLFKFDEEPKTKCFALHGKPRKF